MSHLGLLFRLLSSSSRGTKTCLAIRSVPFTAVSAGRWPRPTASCSRKRAPSASYQSPFLVVLDSHSFNQGLARHRILLCTLLF
ncbi:hypothetical protein OPV22_015288 [Ensete ventricosum]|uniref:Secreted protein n=1 Tax=Ensete ventricosum TaxID=4639 RepID=A0AAV8QZS6_ENSVE|nr:hypothetical protein OPV22_015288 [Ensete ventricosum]